MEGRSIGLKGWLLVAGLLILAAGTSLGFLAATYLAQGARREGPEVEMGGPEGPIPHITNPDFYNSIGLREEQRAQADRILSSHLDKLKRIREEREALGKKVESDLVELLHLDEAQSERMRQFIRQIKISEVAERVSQKVAYYKRELALNAQQEEAVYSIFLDDQLKKDEFFRDLRARAEKGGGEEVRKKMSLMSEERDQKLRPILTDAQWAKLKELEKRRERDFFRRPGPGPFPGPPPPPPPDGDRPSGGPAAAEPKGGPRAASPCLKSPESTTKASPP
jgi:hypothetical protein